MVELRFKCAKVAHRGVGHLMSHRVYVYHPNLRGFAFW